MKVHLRVLYTPGEQHLHGVCSNCFCVFDTHKYEFENAVRDNGGKSEPADCPKCGAGKIKLLEKW